MRTENNIREANDLICAAHSMIEDALKFRILAFIKESPLAVLLWFTDNFAIMISTQRKNLSKEEAMCFFHLVTRARKETNDDRLKILRLLNRVADLAGATSALACHIEADIRTCVRISDEEYNKKKDERLQEVLAERKKQDDERRAALAAAKAKEEQRQREEKERREKDPHLNPTSLKMALENGWKLKEAGLKYTVVTCELGNKTFGEAMPPKKILGKLAEPRRPVAIATPPTKANVGDTGSLLAIERNRERNRSTRQGRGISLADVFITANIH